MANGGESGGEGGENDYPVRREGTDEEGPLVDRPPELRIRGIKSTAPLQVTSQKGEILQVYRTNHHYCIFKLGSTNFWS